MPPLEGSAHPYTTLILCGNDLQIVWGKLGKAGLGCVSDVDKGSTFPITKLIVATTSVHGPYSTRRQCGESCLGSRDIGLSEAEAKRERVSD